MVFERYWFNVELGHTFRTVVYLTTNIDVTFALLGQCDWPSHWMR